MLNHPSLRSCLYYKNKRENYEGQEAPRMWHTMAIHRAAPLHATPVSAVWKMKEAFLQRDTICCLINGHKKYSSET